MRDPRRPTRTPAQPRTQTRVAVRPVVTGRALALGAMVVLLVVLLASPVHRYLASRSALGAASAQLQADQQNLAHLTQLEKQWGDPGFIQQQARARLNFAMPGDTVYVVVDKGAKTKIEKTQGSGASSKAQGPAWNKRLWASVRAAGA